MRFKLKAVGYGKIKCAEIEAAPLTLFVGDNNSGKSYLMSLLWGIQNLGIPALIGDLPEKRTEIEQELIHWVREHANAALKEGSRLTVIGGMAGHLQAVLSERLDQKKDELIQKIFNSADVRIKELQILLTEIENTPLRFERMGNLQGIFLGVGELNGYGMMLSKENAGMEKITDDVCWFLIQMAFACLLDAAPDEIDGFYQNIYLPASRTGFLLTKDLVNKAGRERAFNVSTEQEALTPFIRPINQFLNVINELSSERAGEEALQGIVEYLERGMADGTVALKMQPNREVSYRPLGSEKGMPLRVVSAVVTELAPLILLLKHREGIKGLFYEEPEMCLHPKLQQRMARVLCQLVNAGIGMTVTTHSDLILQHINNMIRLSFREDREDLCRRFGYSKDDILSPDDVKVYQLTAEDDGTAKVEELPCGRNGFAVPTFNDALDRIMDEAYAIQE